MGNRLGDFKQFRVAIREARAPLTSRVYTNRSGYRMTEQVTHEFTMEEIQEIIRAGDLTTLRELSRYFYRTNSAYKNNIDFLASLFQYDWVVIPLFEEGKGSKAQILKAFYSACDFIDKIDLPSTLNRITTEWLISGVYYGILRKDSDKVTIQDLPLQYCRSRFKDFNNLNILEFSLKYFEHIRDEQLREEAISSFPVVVQKAWRQYIAHNREEGEWVMIPAADGGISFSFVNDPIPALIAALPDLKEMEDATKREAKRDENELYKLLIQKMPVDKNGELVFQLEEVADIHASVADMLSSTDTVDVLTTFGDTTLESLQDSTAAAQSTDRLAKYKSNAYGAMGRGELLFNAINSTSLGIQIKKDESIMREYMNIYEAFFKFYLNNNFARKGITYSFQILSTTVFNRGDVQTNYFRGAQYGYSKMIAGVAMGINQLEQLSLMELENNFLDMSARMIPLQSAYTTPGGGDEEKNSSSAKKTVTQRQPGDITNTGGRPELPDDQKSEKTQANIAAAE